MRLVKDRPKGRPPAGRPASRSRARKPRPGANLPLVQFGREAYSELRKAHWPDREQTTRLTAAVVAFSLLMAIILGLADLGFARVFDLILA